MKYSHIIYNSSEKNRDGVAGFGVRCLTEGAPSSLPAVMEENELFNFTEAGPALSPAALSSNPEAIKLIVPTYFFQTVNLPDRTKAFILGRKIAVGFDYTFYINGKPGRLGNYVVDAYAFSAPPTAEEFEIFLENAAPGSQHFMPASPVPSASNTEMKALSVGDAPILPAEEKSFAANDRAEINSKVIDLLFAFIQGRKEGKPVLVKADVTEPPHLMAALARLMPKKQIENLTFITNHTEDGKKRGVNIVFINEYYAYEVFRKQWIWLDMDSEEGVNTPEARIYRPRVEKYLEEGNIQGIHDLVGWCLSDMYEKGKSFPEETQAQLYNYLYDFGNFNLPMVGQDANLRLTLNDYFISEPEEKLRFDEELQRRFHSMKTLSDLWEWIDLVLTLNPIDCKGIIERNRLVVTGAVFANPGNFLQFYTRYRNRFGDVQKFIDRQAFPANEAFLSDEVLRPVWQQVYSFFLKDRLEDENKDYLVERMIEDNLDQIPLQQVLNKERISAKEYINCLVMILAKHDPANEKKVSHMLAEAIKDRNDISLDFFERFPDHINDPDYTPLYEWQLRNHSLISKENIDRLTEYLLRFLRNDDALPWATGVEGSKVFVRLYTALKEVMKKGKISQADVIRICDDLKDSGYPAKNIDSFNILNIIARREEVKDMKKISKVWEITDQIDDREYLKSLIPKKAAYLDIDSKDGDIDAFCRLILDKDLMGKAQIWEFASKTMHPTDYRVALIRNSGMKAQETLDFLIADGGMTDEEGMTFLSIKFPKMHAEIMKSREPSVMKKISNMFKGLFGGKDKE